MTNQEQYELIWEKAKKYDRLVDALDKIKAELLATSEMHKDGGYYLRDKWVSEIIDKYKAESEASE